MRVAVLPRDVAAGVITGSISRIGWAVGAANLLIMLPVLVETGIREGIADDLPRLVGITLLQLALLGAAALRPRAIVIVGYLVLGGATAVWFQVDLLATLPVASDQYVYLLNRSAIALVLVGTTATSTAAGVSWLLVGAAVAAGSLVASAAIAGAPFRPGLGPQTVLMLGLVAYFTFAIVQRSQRRRVPNFDELEAETMRLARGEDLARRTTAAVHDTLLNDLSFVMNGPDRLDERASDRLRADLDTLTSAEWLRAAALEDAAPDQQDAELRNAIMRMVSDFQWRGLTVQVTGAGWGVYRLADEVADALLGALRAALENVHRHSGVSVADIVLAYEEGSVTVMVTDQGHGFAPREVPEDRLGVRVSIEGRVRDVGGSVSVWSAPGAGTSVVLRAPVQEVLRPHPRTPTGDGS